MRTHLRVVVYKRWASGPLFRSPIPISTREASSRISHVRWKKGCMRDLCPRLFLGRTGRAVFPHIVRTDAEPIVSYLGYIGRLWSAYRPRRRPEENLRLASSVYRGQGTRARCQDIAYLRSDIPRAPASIRISACYNARVCMCVRASKAIRKESESLYRLQDY